MWPEAIITVKQSHQPIKTPIGFLIGRDAIYLNQVSFIEGDLVIEGSFNGALASDPPDKDAEPRFRRRDYLYFLRFSQVLAHSMVEGNAFTHYASLHQDDTDDSDSSSFDEIVNSKWIRELGVSADSFKHYFVSTYDIVFNIICKDLTMSVYQRVAS